MTDRRLPEAIRRSIVEQVAAMTPREETRTFALALPTELADDLPEYLLSLRAVKNDDGGAINLKKTGQWHHQLRIDGEPRKFAVSQEVAPETWRVHAVWSSEISGSVDAALSWIDQELHTNADAAILVVPAFLTYAVLLGRPQEDSPADLGVVVATTPEGGNLKRRYRYSLPEFVAALREQTPSDPFSGTSNEA
jgi:hypothetical protein